MARNLSFRSRVAIYVLLWAMHVTALFGVPQILRAALGDAVDLGASLVFTIGMWAVAGAVLFPFVYSRYRSIVPGPPPAHSKRLRDALVAGFGVGAMAVICGVFWMLAQIPQAGKIAAVVIYAILTGITAALYAYLGPAILPGPPRSQAAHRS